MSWAELELTCRSGIATANFTLYYDLMPYVGLLSTGVAATARGPIELPEVIKR